jgi:hypothetical protein
MFIGFDGFIVAPPSFGKAIENAVKHTWYCFSNKEKI